MGKKLDLENVRFGRLVAKRVVAQNIKNKSMVWECVCDCGNRTLSATGLLRSGQKQSCGCLRKERAYEKTAADLRGKKYNRLTVIEDSGERKGRGILWLCRCDCGNYTKQKGSVLKNGIVKSCGCFQSEDLSGKRFGRLVVLRYSGKSEVGSSRHKIWECVCDCGNLVSAKTGNLRNGHTESCGCLAIEARSGENNPRYNPDLTEEERLRRNRYTLGGGKVKDFRKTVFERDDYTCQICGVRNGNGKRVVLNAHHLDGWNWAKDKRFDPNNGITLCQKCHDGFHRSYGSGNNTREQFEEYLKEVLA